MCICCSYKVILILTNQPVLLYQQNEREMEKDSFICKKKNQKKKTPQKTHTHTTTTKQPKNKQTHPQNRKKETASSPHPLPQQINVYKKRKWSREKVSRSLLQPVLLQWQISKTGRVTMAIIIQSLKISLCLHTVSNKKPALMLLINTKTHTGTHAGSQTVVSTKYHTTCSFCRHPAELACVLKAAAEYIFWVESKFKLHPPPPPPPTQLPCTHTEWIWLSFVWFDEWYDLL